MTTKILLIPAALLATASFSLLPGANTSASDLRKETSDRASLAKLQASASSAERQADQLAQFLQNRNLSVDAHIGKLDAIKGEINKMGREAARLESDRASLPPLEQQAVDKTLPMLQQAAVNLTSAYSFIRENRDQLWSPAYRDYTNNILQESGQVAKTLGDYLKYAKLQDQELQLQHNLAVGGN